VVTRAPRTPPGLDQPQQTSPFRLSTSLDTGTRGVVKTARNRLRVTMTGRFRSVFLRAFFFFFYWLVLVLAGCSLLV
jgi:hypothetical protein